MSNPTGLVGPPRWSHVVDLADGAWSLDPSWSRTVLDVYGADDTEVAAHGTPDHYLAAAYVYADPHRRALMADRFPDLRVVVAAVEQDTETFAAVSTAAARAAR